MATSLEGKLANGTRVLMQDAYATRKSDNLRDIRPSRRSCWRAMRTR
jgi:hypothetical protein